MNSAYQSDRTSVVIDAQPQAIDVRGVPIDSVREPSAFAEETRERRDHHDSAWLRYEPEVVDDYYRSRPWQAWTRAIGTFFPILSFAFGVWLDKTWGKLKKNQAKRAVQFRLLLTKLGPAYIKIGQALSTRPDLVPTTYLDELTKLQDKIPPFSNEIAFQFIEDGLGDSPQYLYAEISAEPIAAASLGQVYKGKLKTGETVAIKVQRPGLMENIALDIYLMRSLCQWARNTFPQIRTDLVSIVDEFAARIFEEMDYENEGRNAEKFARLYESFEDVYIPKIHWEFTSRRVLTMEWIEGTKLTDVRAIAEKGINATYLIEVGVQCSLHQLLEHGFFHADPHPGNLLAMNNGKLAYLDFGMMSQVKDYQRYGLLEAIVHLVNRDFDGLAKDFVKLEFLTPDTDLTPIIPAFAKVFNSSMGESGTNVAELDFKSVTDQLSGVMYEFPFRVPAYYALIVRSLVTLEGMAVAVDPDFKVLSEAYPYVAKRLLTDPAPDLRNSLQDLLFKDGYFRWNRLENLLNNARGNEDYDLSLVLNQSIDFLLSDRGAFIRDQLADEVVRSLDGLGQSTWDRFKSRFQGQPVKFDPAAVAANNTLGHIQRIWGILQNTKGFDPMVILPIIPQILTKSETQNLGRRIASGLAQKFAARLIREVLLQGDPIIPEQPLSLPSRKSA
jgi:predicted unusual protein kinase regulating ubiquinone biosynthesis (AarF/ABC1/UbiB family)